MIDDMIAIVSSPKNNARLLHAGKEIFRSENRPLDKYIEPWVTSSRGAVLADKKVFFVSCDGKAISLLMDKVAIDRGNQIEHVHHIQTQMVDIWADKKYLVCLSQDGNLDTVSHRSKSRHVMHSSEVNKQAFADSPFGVGKNVAIALTGCSRYLAVATYNHESNSNSMFLLSRQGKVKSKVTGIVHTISRTSHNPVHRMEFIIYEKCIYLVAQNLFAVVSLFLVNPRRAADLIYIRTNDKLGTSVQWPLIPIPGKPGYMLSSESCHLLQISLNYGLGA